MAAIIPALGFPVYFRTDDVHWLGWAAAHDNPLAAFNPAENLFGYFRPIPTLVWWALFRLFQFNPWPYQFTLALAAVLAMWPLFRICARAGGGPWAGLLGVGLFHAAWYGILYYVYWFSALTFGLEILFLLLAFDALTDGEELPGRPVAFVICALAAGLCKQPALVLLPLTGGLLILASARNRPRGRAWAAGIAVVALALLFLTPFVVHRPERLAGLRGDFVEFVGQRFRFYAATLLRGPGVLIVMGAAGAAVGRALSGGRSGAGWAGLVSGIAAGALVGRIDLRAGAAVWTLLLVAAALAERRSRPWVAGFLIPVVALFGVDFFVATYLLEPALMLVPALVIWVAPLAAPAGRALEERMADRRVRGFVVPVVLIAAAVLVFVARPLVAPVKSMRDVRATFRSLVSDLASREAAGTTLGSLSYEELGRSYAEIREESLETRVARHKTMNPAQLGKLLGLLGRPDLSVVSVEEALAATGPVRLVALNESEREILRRIPGSREIRTFAAGGASAAIFAVARPPDP